MLKEMIRMFKVGDRVWCSMYGWGFVCVIHKDEYYGIHCKFDNGESDSFIKNGKISYDGLRVLFFDEVVPKESALVRPEMM
jgi:hypothetical protein